MIDFKSKYSVKILDVQEMKNTNGGGVWGKIGGWTTIAIEEAVDIIISNGQNLVDAYNNGCKAARSLHE